ncbi:phage virion morphogenesis (putative tail completion) protein [Variovorax sp. YR266]|uniref:phage virion morphogenesis protein n=1 Tax=Variovorax sp. YR266 TaxID=1884386 RepID=UPI0008971FF3|nr:phage virion morphogenesis protein [Variovorax sp. YR266]SDZ71323.1 phage virion morphogenesis (putative tail completion) protein [Variovorax sp. YR266]
MADDLRALEDWATPLLSQLTAPKRRALARQIGQALRRKQAERIASQRNPDGTAYEPRKTTNARLQKGRIRRTMFEKLRAARHLRVEAEDDGVAVGFFGRTARIASVHHEGLRDLVQPGGPSYKYPARGLLAMNDEERELVKDMLLQHLAP